MNDFLLFAVAMAAMLCHVPRSGAQDLQGLTWSQQKCVLYDHAVDAALGFQGRTGLRDAFLDANRSFIEGGCETPGYVCPVTDAEIRFANLLTVMTMNEGMASTFVPFNCR